MAHIFMRKYEFIEHAADIGIRIKAGDLKELFKNTAQVMFGLIAEKKGKKGRQEKIEIKQKADNLEELFINWLNELLSLSAVKGLIFSDFKIDKLDKNILQAVAIGGQIKNYKVNTEIKAATYHELHIGKTNSGWQAEVIFDV